MMDLQTHNIHLFKEQKLVSCHADQSILEATLKAGVNHTHACGGQGKCSTCRILVTEGVEYCHPRNGTEQRIADNFNFPKEIRLACQTKVEGDISIRRMVFDKLDMDIISEQFSENFNTTLGSQQKLAIVFTDIVNYTSFAEKFPPYDVVHELNRYYRLMNTVIQEHNGIISDLIGDGILAAFGMDAKDQNSVLDAVNAIKEMKLKLEVFNQSIKENYNVSFGIRAGVHYGNVIVGPFDIGAMKKIALIGDNVNYASRIESSNKKFNTELLLSEEAYHEVKDQYPKFNLFETSIKGKTGKYNLYEISLDTTS